MHACGAPSNNPWVPALQALNEHQQNILRLLQQQRLAEMMAGANPNAELLQRQQAMQAQQLQQQRLQQLHAQQVGRHKVGFMAHASDKPRC